MNDFVGKKKILIVEDEPLISSYIAHVLKEFSFSITGCSSSGSEAIALAEQHRPRLAVVDIHISGNMDGIEVARALRDRFGIPTIFLSGVTDSETIERARALGSPGILRKPFLPSELLDAVERALPSGPLPFGRSDAVGEPAD
jgi:two-component system, sensor histidine kinase and response regulator